VLGIDIGITMVMAENARTGFIWEHFMKNDIAKNGMDRAGFHALPTPELPSPPKPPIPNGYPIWITK
jgi:hypothetical protein